MDEETPDIYERMALRRVAYKSSHEECMAEVERLRAYVTRAYFLLDENKPDEAKKVLGKIGKLGPYGVIA